MSAEFYTHEGLDLNDHVLPALLKLLRTEALGRVWLIRAEGRDAGYMILTFGYDIEFGGPVATLTDLYLKPEFRGGGSARRRSVFWKCSAVSGD